MIIKIGHMYLEYFSVDNFDNDINLRFTSQVDNAKMFSDEDILIVKPIIQNLFTFDNIYVVYSEGGDKNDN